MQYLKEQPDGSRVRVSEFEAQMDKRQPGYKQIVADKGLLIYGMQAPVKVARPLRYGGRNNDRSPIGYRGA